MTLLPTDIKLVKILGNIILANTGATTIIVQVYLFVTKCRYFLFTKQKQN